MKKFVNIVFRIGDAIGEHDNGKGFVIAEHTLEFYAIDMFECFSKVPVVGDSLYVGLT